MFHEEDTGNTIDELKGQSQKNVDLFNCNIFSKSKEMQLKVSQQQNFFTAARRNVNTFH